MTMVPDDELLMAYADGELDPDRARTVEAAIAGDPAVAARVEGFRADRRRLSAAFGPVADEPVPDRLLQAILAEGPAAPVDLHAERARRRAGRAWTLPQGLAMAACLAAGVAIGLAPQLLRQDPVLRVEPGVAAEGVLAEALDRRLAADAAGGAVRVGLSFRAMDGTYCRTFQAGQDAPVAGLACREGDGWKVRLAMTAEPSAGGEYRLAAADMPAALLEAVEGLIDGAPLDGPGEAAARDRGWRAPGGPDRPR